MDIGETVVNKSSIEAKLHFTGPAILVGGGALNDKVLLQLAREGFPVLAADGGANHLSNLELTPHAIIGDMDSLSPEPGNLAEAKIVKIEEQETTDFEKCLYTVEAHSFFCFGFLDGRIDHTLATMHVLTKYSDRTIVLIGTEDMLIPVNNSIDLTVGRGCRVSIYPMTRCEFGASKGLKYPLDKLVMEQGTLIGTSNEAVEDHVEIILRTGCYALILEIGKLEADLSSLGFVPRP